jgi:hypothetical protein
VEAIAEFPMTTFELRAFCHLQSMYPTEYMERAKCCCWLFSIPQDNYFITFDDRVSDAGSGLMNVADRYCHEARFIKMRKVVHAFAMISALI